MNLPDPLDLPDGDRGLAGLAGTLAFTRREASLMLYKRAAAYAETRGIILADTKLEFGLDPATNQPILIDEVLTPDSSRFWPRNEYVSGRSQPSFDKQFVRDYLLSIKWDKKPPTPHLPPDIIRQTSERYREAYRLLTAD
jgi:phosphoribosylaminoimidazole-succinocarboxamide synthase